MNYETLANLSSASGAAITEGEKALIEDLVFAFRHNYEKNVERTNYYEDKTRVSFAGINIRESIEADIRTDVGWCGKGVDLLAARSVFDGFTVNDEADNALTSVMSECDFGAEYSRAVPSQLIHGYGLWTVTRGGEGQPAVSIRYYNGLNSSAVWDYTMNRIEAALVIDGYERVLNGASLIPSLCVVHTNDSVLVFRKQKNMTSWVVERLANNMGRPMAVPMVYRSNLKPLGKSRISKAAMRITDNMRREIFLMNIQSRKHSLPTKYITNASDSLMEGMEKSAVYNDEMLVIGKDEDGETVTIGQLQAASPENHIKVMDKLANEIAAEFSLPVATFGVAGNGYTSSDALRASTDDIIMEAKQLNRDNGKALKQVARMALAILGNCSYDDVADSVSVHWIDPAMPSAAQRADALVKQVSMMPWLADTDVILEQLDYDEPTRARLMRQKADAQAAQSLTAALMGAVGGTGQQAVETPQQAAQRAAE